MSSDAFQIQAVPEIWTDVLDILFQHNSGFSLWKIGWGGQDFPHLGKLVGGKRDFTNLYDKNTNYDLLYALSAMKSYLTTILS